MKSLGGNGSIVTKAGVPVEDALRYVLSLPIATLVSGIDSEKVLDQNLKIVREFKPHDRRRSARAIEAADRRRWPATAGSSCSSRRRRSTARSTASSTASPLTCQVSWLSPSRGLERINGFEHEGTGRRPVWPLRRAASFAHPQGAQSQFQRSVLSPCASDENRGKVKRRTASTALAVTNEPSTSAPPSTRTLVHRRRPSSSVSEPTSQWPHESCGSKAFTTGRGALRASLDRPSEWWR